MEGSTVTVRVLSIEHSLTSQDFMTQTAIIDSTSLLIKPCPPVHQIKVINSLLYYVISVVHKVRIEDYQKHVQKSISSYYLQNGMKIKIYEYSKICSDLLSVNVYECVHILHYLVYGCFSSAAYVNMLVETKDVGEKKPDRKVVKCRDHQKETGDEGFIKDLEEVLRVDKDQKEVTTKYNGYNKRIVSNPYEVKLPQVQGKQTSPIINILRRQEFEAGAVVKISKRIRLKPNVRLMNTLFCQNIKDKSKIVEIEKKVSVHKKIDLKSLLEIKQKLKSDNQFLDQLRVSLTTSENQFRSVRSREPFQLNIQKFEIKTPLEGSKTRSHQVSQLFMPSFSSVVEKKTQGCVRPIDDTPQDAQSSKQNDNFQYKVMASTQKTPFRSRLNFYKKEYKLFLSSGSQRFSHN